MEGWQVINCSDNDISYVWSAIRRMTSTSGFIIQSPPAGDWKLYLCQRKKKIRNVTEVKIVIIQCAMGGGHIQLCSVLVQNQIFREYRSFDLLMISLQHFGCIFMLMYVFNHGVTTTVVAQTSTSCHCRATTPAAQGHRQRWCPWVGWRHEGCAPLPGSQHPESTTRTGNAWLCLGAKGQQQLLSPLCLGRLLSCCATLLLQG